MGTVNPQHIESTGRYIVAHWCGCERYTGSRDLTIFLFGSDAGTNYPKITVECEPWTIANLS